MSMDLLILNKQNQLQLLEYKDCLQTTSSSILHLHLNFLYLFPSSEVVTHFVFCLPETICQHGLIKMKFIFCCKDFYQQEILRGFVQSLNAKRTITIKLNCHPCIWISTSFLKVSRVEEGKRFIKKQNFHMIFLRSQDDAISWKKTFYYWQDILSMNRKYIFEKHMHTYIYKIYMYIMITTTLVRISLIW